MNRVPTSKAERTWQRGEPPHAEIRKHCGDPMGKGEIFCDFCGRILYSPS